MKRRRHTAKAKYRKQLRRKTRRSIHAAALAKPHFRQRVVMSRKHRVRNPVDAILDHEGATDIIDSIIDP